MTPETQQIFNRALALHQRGDHLAAQSLYEKVLQREPRHFDSLHLLGLTQIQGGDAEAGVASITRALALRGDFPEAHYNRGHALLGLGRAAEALADFDTAVRLNPRDPHYHFERGNALSELKRWNDALASFDQALALAPRFAEAHNNAGIALKEAGRLDEALVRYERAIALRANYAEAHGNRGNVLKELGRLEDAMASHDKAIALRPDHAEAHSNRGNVLAQLRLFEEALASHDRALVLRPDYAEAHNNRAIALKELGRTEEALATYDAAIQLRPNYVEALSNRGNVLKELGRLDEAMDSFDRAIALEPGHAEAYINRGNLLKDLDRPEEALANYETAERLRPAHPLAPYNTSLLLLQRQDFDRGFDLYRHRWEADTTGDKGPRTRIPAWDGSRLDGEVLLWAEQGLGDEVFFASLLPLLEREGQSFALSADNRLHPIYARSFPGIRLLDGKTTRSEVEGAFAAQAAIGDLGRILRPDAAMLARRPSPFLMVDAARKASMRAAVQGDGRGLVCGLSWRSGNRKEGRARSVDIAALGPVLSCPGVSFVNLQYGDVSAELGLAREAFGAEVRCLPDLDVYNDIDGLAALIAACDVVVTIDNVTAHLAGAVAAQAALLVPRGAGRHWYWGDGPRSLWYPSLRLLFQEARGDWTQPIGAAARFLRQASEGAAP